MVKIKEFRTDVQVMQSAESAEKLLESAEKLAEHYKQILSFIDEYLKYSAELFFTQKILYMLNFDIFRDCRVSGIVLPYSHATRIYLFATRYLFNQISFSEPVSGTNPMMMQNGR